MSNAFDIPAIRNALGLNQTGLAKRLGINQATVSRWEKFGVPEGGLARTTLERLAEEARTAQPTNSKPRPKRKKRRAA